MSKYHNKILGMLSAAVLAEIEPHLVAVDLPLRMVMEEAGAPVDFIYFIEVGIGSIVARLGSQRETEIGLLGFDGVTGTAVILGDDLAVHDCYMQVAGHGYRVSVDAFSALISQSPEMRRVCTKFVQCLHIQTGYTALINARLKLENRLARWLLMCGDRVVGDKLILTHEFIAVMLGARRPSVTIALHILEGKGLIRSNRGEIIIRDRQGLVDLAGRGYGIPEAHYERLMGTLSNGRYVRMLTEEGSSIALSTR